jgi:hypothetical protein
MRGAEIAKDDKDDIMPWWSLPPPVLQKTYLQPVPGQIVNAYCDYRGRMWYTIYQSTYVSAGCCVSEISLAASIKAQVEKQWAGNQPVVIKGGEVALFEPGGRVWIVSGKELLGYDGNSWRKGSLYRMEAACPGHGGWNCYNWAVGKMCFFSTSTDEGIICFDNDRWVPLEDPAAQKNRKSYFWSLAGLRDETGLVAWNCQPNEAWVYRWGRWNRLTLPKELAEVTEERPNKPGFSKRPARGVAVDAGNNLWILTDDGIVSMPLGHAATQNVEALKKFTASTEPPTLGKIASVGTYQIGKAFRLSQEHNGTILISAESIRHEGRELGGGLLIVDPDGVPRFLANSSLAKMNGFSLTLDGKRILVQGDFRGIIDLRQKEPEYQPFDMPNQPFIQCIGSDGRYYLEDDPYGTRHSGILYALDPAQRDERPPLSAMRVDLQSDPYCVASDGSIWAAVEGKGLSRFRDGQWQVLVPLGDQPWIQTSGNGYKSRKEQVRALWAGTNGVVLAVLHDQTAILFNGDKQIRAKSVRDLVAENLAVIAASFSKDAPRSVNNENNGITADRKGNLYVQEAHDRLSIYLTAEHRWESVPDYDSERPPQVYGDGSKVLLFKRTGGLHEASCETPTEFVRKPLGLSSPLVLDPAGGLFALESRPVDPDGWGSNYIYRVLLVGQKTAVVSQERAMPKAFDPAGILWTECFDDTRSNDSKPCTLRLFKGDQRIQDIELAEGVARNGLCIVSDTAGSVYIWTGFGLRHYVLDQALAHYRLAGLYRMTCDGKNMRIGWRVTVAGNFLVSSAGFSSSSLDSPAGIIYLTPLPKEQDKTSNKKTEYTGFSGRDTAAKP